MATALTSSLPKLLGTALRRSLLALAAAAACTHAVADTGLRLYTLDCGGAEFKDFAAASDTGDYDGRPARLANPCFLVRHPKGWLLWDAGLPETLPASVTGGMPAPDMLDKFGFRTWVDRPLAEQLQALGLKPDDVAYLAFSHLHFDHTGNANQFTRATWLLNRAELAWAQATPSHLNIAPELFSAHAQAKRRVFDGDLDVFGDSTVRILGTPGHTPGSSVLLLRLPKAGYVLLSGDLYLTLEGRQHAHVPAVNADRAATLASIGRVEAIARRLGARVVVQHDPVEFARLPKPPAFLD